MPRFPEPHRPIRVDDQLGRRELERRHDALARALVKAHAIREHDDGVLGAHDATVHTCATCQLLLTRIIPAEFEDG